jgi:hypothetical protein
MELTRAMLESELKIKDEVIDRQRVLLEQCKVRLSEFHGENIELKRRLDCFTKGTMS